MGATMAASGEKAVSPVVSSIQDISLDRIRESNSNPRRVFDELRLRELAENIKVHGVLQPVLVRPLPGGPEGTYELVAGARRFRASKLAGKQAIPATTRELNDAECREIQLIENLQRADIHELDEALGYRALRDLNPELYTVETIAAKVGKTTKYVYGRMKLVELIPAVQTAFYEGRRLGHDNHHRLFQVYGWEEKKLKTSWGGMSVEHEKLTQEQIRSMKIDDLNRFIVTCALVPDLYCPGYSSAEALSKEANLVRTAARYKVDTSKITARVTAELSAKKKPARGKSRAASSRPGR